MELICGETGIWWDQIPEILSWHSAGGSGWRDKDKVTPSWWCITSPELETWLNFVYIGFSFVNVLTQIRFFPLPALHVSTSSPCVIVFDKGAGARWNPELSAQWWLHLQPVLLTPCLLLGAVSKRFQLSWCTVEALCADMVQLSDWLNIAFWKW